MKGSEKVEVSLASYWSGVGTRSRELSRSENAICESPFHLWWLQTILLDAKGKITSPTLCVFYNFLKYMSCGQRRVYGDAMQ